jgi:hypothetical protein
MSKSAMSLNIWNGSVVVVVGDAIDLFDRDAIQLAAGQLRRKLYNPAVIALGVDVRDAIRRNAQRAMIGLQSARRRIVDRVERENRLLTRLGPENSALGA